MVTLWQAQDPATAIPFDRNKNTGLYHLALLVDDRAVLDALHKNLAKHSEVRIEFSPEPLGIGKLIHMMAIIPGGIRVDFVAPEN